ncbi:hypothetical protein L1987_23727 [Smallanthus sonchifolius]|uniref:Uncharacterized protein n=1 Tax=Smallanthus sonchifolius TaxID=185202 RepID=A0ACB9IJD0_9ASTR|nr:hypothetical protein L1987_23727 [Smallanthus sonchifolius]
MCMDAMCNLLPFSKLIVQISEARAPNLNGNQLLKDHCQFKKNSLQLKLIDHDVMEIGLSTKCKFEFI